MPGGIDQPFNAAQVVQRKAGVWIPRKRYTARRAEKALKGLLSTPTSQEHVRKIQAQIMQEDGVALLCTAVERVLRDCYGSPKGAIGFYSRAIGQLDPAISGSFPIGRISITR